jgi:hypothetical protein
MAGSVINTFDKGLHQDSSFILQPDGTYRNMKNGMLISYDGNHYTVEMTKGNKVLLKLTPRYLTTTATLDVEPMPIGFVSFIDKLVVFSTNSESTTGYGEIGVISFTRSEMDFVGSYVPYYHNADLNFTKLHKIEGFSFRENTNNQRVYWTDNFNEPKVFDIANPIFTTYFTGAADLIANNTYMVLQGAVTYNGVKYGVGLTAGNIFKASAGTSYTLPVGAPLVIEYYPLSLLDWSPSRLLGNIEFKEYGTGDKYCGSHIYFYRLSNSYDGVVTSWSYASTPIHVGMNNSSTFITGNAYRDFVGNGTATTLENSGKSVKLNITDIDTDFDTIEVACAEFTQVADVPYRIIITNKEAVTGATMSITDTGASNLGTVTISDLTLFPASILKCKTVNTNKNYSTIANITEREEFDLDLSGVTINQFQYPLVSHGDLNLCSNCNVPADVSPPLTGNPPANSILPYSRWLVTFGNNTTDTVTYKGVQYVTGDVITGSFGAIVTVPSSILFTGNGAVRPCTTKNKYTAISDGKRREDAIQLTTGFWDYKDPAVASHNKGYWSGEKYRFGILFFDLKGNPFYVKYIKGDPTTFDYTFDTIPDKGGLMKKDNYRPSGGALIQDSYSLNPSAINISGLDIPESVMNQISGFSIVRAERDPIVITQGLLMQSVYSNLLGFNSVMPLGICRTDYSILPMYEVGDGYYIYSVLSPDIQTGYSFPSAVKIGDNLKEACWLNGSQLKTDTQKRVMFTKLFQMSAGIFGTGKDASSPRTLPLQSMNGNAVYNFDENNGAGGFLGTSVDYRNRYSNVNEFQVTLNYDSICGVTPFSPGFDILSVGCKKQIIKSQFNHFDALTDYNATANTSNYNKMLANFITDTDPANQYGGASESAIANTLYMSCGHFQPINTQVKADTLNGTFASGIYAGENKYTFNDIEVFGGDCFTNLIDLGYGLWDEAFETSDNAMSYALWFPCEGNVNYNLRRGQKVSNKNMYPSSGATGIGWFDSSLSPTTQLESYNYNKAYTTDGNFIKYPSLPLNYKFTGEFDYRIRWSKYKTPGELIDSFRVFRIPDYRDLDGQRGQINNLKARDSKLFYWQDHSVGYTPILERQLVGGSALGDATALGVTGVIDRYDDIDTNFGNQHQHGLTETEYGFAWFDMRRRAFMVMGIGSKPEEMSMVKGLQVFFNNEFNEGNIFYPNSFSNIYNTNNLDIPEIPLMGYGIVGVYDPTFKMTYLTFKYAKRDFIGESNESFVNRDFTLGYNHILNAFVAFTDCTPAIWHNHNDLVLTANNPKNTKAYNTDMPSTSFVIGDTVLVGNVEYICVKDVTIASYPGTLTAITGTNPLAPSSNSWLAINKTNEIYLQNFGADLCKFYGKVWDFEQEVVVNFKTDMAVTPQNMQVKTIGPNSTSVYFDTENQSASDLNISTTNRNYRFIDGAWFFSVALDSLRGRLTDYYVRVKFIHKNYVTNPTTAKNIQKVSQWLKTFFVSKR